MKLKINRDVCVMPSCNNKRTTEEGKNPSPEDQKAGFRHGRTYCFRPMPLVLREQRYQTF